MATDYNTFTTAKLSKEIEKMQAELQRRENLEKEQRWTEVRDIVHNWIQDYGGIPLHIDFLETSLDQRDDYSTIGEIYITGGE